MPKTRTRIRTTTMPQKKKESHVNGPPSPVVRIEKLVPGGDGLGHLDDGVVFVPLTVPGDVVSLISVRKRRGVTFAEPDEFFESSTERRDPPCPWFGECGGCQWMNMDYAAQLRWKEDIFKQALMKIARIRDLPSIVVHPAPSEFQYRFRARLQIKGPHVGFYQRGSNRIVPWERCMQLPDTLNLVVADLRAWLKENRAPASLMSCEAALSPVDGSVTLCWVFSHNKDDGRAAGVIMDGVKKRVLFQDVHLAGQAAYDKRGKTIEIRDKSLTLEVSGVRIPASPGTFSQVNPGVNSILVARTLDHLRSANVLSLLDLYCGNGNFSLPAAAAGIETVGVEASPQAVHDALSVAGPRSRFIKMDVGRFLSRDKSRPDAVVLDPPRTGLPVEVSEELGARRYPLVVYVSCEPSTLARDLARLTHAGYTVTGIELFDMFPQTSHSEALVVMKG